MPATTHPGAPGAPALPATHAVAASGITVSLHIGPNGFATVAHWSTGFTSRTLNSGWHATPALAWAALGTKIAPYLNGSALNHVA